MAILELYHCPLACSQVSVCALEEAGLGYTLHLVDIRIGEQMRPEYLAISPLNKVPAAIVDGRALTENAAILTYIARSAPGSAVLPGIDADPWLQAQAQSGLSFCGGTLHPQLRGMMAPHRITAGDDLDGVRRKSAEMMRRSFAYAEERIAREGWWLGHWSIVDVYLNWTFSVGQRAGFDGSAFPALAGLRSRLEREKASFRCMLEIDAAGLQTLAQRSSVAST